MLFLNRCTAASKPERGISGKNHNKEQYKLSTDRIWNFVSRCSAMRETSPSSRRILDAFVCCGRVRGPVTTRPPQEGGRGKRMYTLYSMQRSGNCYKVRLALSQLRTSYNLVEIDILRGESRTPEFLTKNPDG